LVDPGLSGVTARRRENPGETGVVRYASAQILLLQDVLFSERNLSSVVKYIKYYQRGPLVKYTILTALFALILIMLKIYGEYNLLKRARGQDKVYINDRISKLNFAMVIILTSVIGIMIGTAIYWIVEEP
jgi:hypothetical protein